MWVTAVQLVLRLMPSCLGILSSTWRTRVFHCSYRPCRCRSATRRCTCPACLQRHAEGVASWSALSIPHPSGQVWALLEATGLYEAPVCLLCMQQFSHDCHCCSSGALSQRSVFCVNADKAFQSHLSYLLQHYHLHLESSLQYPAVRFSQESGAAFSQQTSLCIQTELYTEGHVEDLERIEIQNICYQLIVA